MLKVSKFGVDLFGVTTNNHLFVVVANTDNSNYARMAACLQIKNCLKSNSANVQQTHHRNWLQIGQQDRIEIKNNAFSALGSEQK